MEHLGSRQRTFADLAAQMVLVRSFKCMALRVVSRISVALLELGLGGPMAMMADDFYRHRFAFPKEIRKRVTDGW